MIACREDQIECRTVVHFFFKVDTSESGRMWAYGCALTASLFQVIRDTSLDYSDLVTRVESSDMKELVDLQSHIVR